MTEIITTCALAFCAINADLEFIVTHPPTLYDACWSVTNYWPFDEDGNPVAWNGQADASPSLTANGTHITPDSAWDIAAVPLPLVGQMIQFPNGHRVYAADTFGHPVYQAGVFWHSYYEAWVIGVDILTDEPLHYLECEGVVLR